MLSEQTYFLAFFGTILSFAVDLALEAGPRARWKIEEHHFLDHDLVDARFAR
ncbi:hypothetical protein WN48_09305 [Eufriesea mexicana]|uniref:Uncharacterized protein n=1 Tax=Eufriesea mexicana TaxID=516756 RepID=A0A310SE82_9HYME|nr:hypothetical protein WN48_09305 [Eufriesea mexicana]